MSEAKITTRRMNQTISLHAVRCLLHKRTVWVEVPVWGWITISAIRKTGNQIEVRSLASDEWHPANDCLVGTLK